MPNGRVSRFSSLVAESASSALGGAAVPRRRKADSHATVAGCTAKPAPRHGRRGGLLHPPGGGPPLRELEAEGLAGARGLRRAEERLELSFAEARNRDLRVDGPFERVGDEEVAARGVVAAEQRAHVAVLRERAGLAPRHQRALEDLDLRDELLHLVRRGGVPAHALLLRAVPVAGLRPAVEADAVRAADAGEIRLDAHPLGRFGRLPLALPERLRHDERPAVQRRVLPAHLLDAVRELRRAAEAAVVAQVDVVAADVARHHRGEVAEVERGVAGLVVGRVVLRGALERPVEVAAGLVREIPHPHELVGVGRDGRDLAPDPLVRLEVNLPSLEETLDEFISVMRQIAEEAKTNPDEVKSAPHNTPIGRVDDVLAAKHPVTNWKTLKNEEMKD